MPCRDDSPIGSCWPDEQKFNEAKKRLDKVTSMLCALCRKIEDVELLGNEHALVGLIPPDIMQWWEQHKKDDEKRIAAEEKKKEAERAKKIQQYHKLGKELGFE